VGFELPQPLKCTLESLVGEGPEQIVGGAEFKGAEGLALSATMTPHVSAVAELIQEVRKDPEAGSRWILVGGYPFGVDPDLWREVGADAMALDALEATGTAARLSEVR